VTAKPSTQQMNFRQQKLVTASHFRILQQHIYDLGKNYGKQFTGTAELLLIHLDNYVTDTIVLAEEQQRQTHIRKVCRNVQRAPDRKTREAEQQLQKEFRHLCRGLPE
jgi:hypothetical protein